MAPTILSFLGACISTLAALYIGWRNRQFNVRLARFENELGETMTARRICLTLGARALLIGERAGEIRRFLTVFDQLVEGDRLAEIDRRMSRFNAACDAFVEGWVELGSWRLGSVPLADGVDQLSNTLEIARLHMFLAAKDENHLLPTEALGDVERLAASIHGLCLRLADDLAFAPPLAIPKAARLDPV
jgi:hypothetical protein